MAAIHLLKVSRLEALSDGIFAIAMTIMVLNLQVPTHVGTTDVLPLIKDDLKINLAVYIGSFVILGTHWVAMNFQLGLLERLNRLYLWTNMLFLMVMCIIPFSANLLGEYPDSVDSIYFYAGNLLCSSLAQIIMLHTAHYYKLNKSIYTPEIYSATLHRIFVAPLFYAGAILLAKTSILFAFIMLVFPTFLYIIPGKIDRYESNDV